MSAGPKWAAALVMSPIIAFAAGTPIGAMLALFPSPYLALLTLPVQAAILGISAFLLLRVEPPLRRWGLGCLTTGLLFLLSVPCILLLAVPGIGEASVAGAGDDRDSATALLFVLMIFGLPMLAVGVAFLTAGLVLMRKARSG